MSDSANGLSNIQSRIDQVVAKLHAHQNQMLQQEAIEEISILIEQSEDPQFIDSITLRVADVFVKSFNQLRAVIVTEVFQRCGPKIERYLQNKEVFLKRIENPLVSNDPRCRILSLQILSHLPSFLITRLNVQHLILHILTTSQDEQERRIATQTIGKISMGSEMFAKSIMNQVEVRVISGYFNPETSAELILAMSNVPGDANTAVAFFQTVERIYDHPDTIQEVRPALLRSLLRMTLKAPILLDPVLKFVLEIESFEGIQILSRKFPLPAKDCLDKLKTILAGKNTQEQLTKDQTWFVMTCANQYLLFDIDHLNDKEVQSFKVDWALMKQQINLDKKCKFATSHYLYILQKMNNSNEYTNNIDLDMQQLLYTRLHTDKSLKTHYSKQFTFLEEALTRNQNELTSQTLFYLYQSSSSVSRQDPIIIAKKAIASGDRVSAHNFMSAFISEPLAKFTVESLKDNKDLLFELATRHFIKSPEYLPYLVESLNLVLNQSSTKVLDTNHFYSLSFVEQYLFICLNQCQLTHELNNLPQGAEKETALLQMYNRAQECIDKATQVLQRFNFDGRSLLELPYDPIQKDATQESFHHFMLHQLCTLTLQRVYTEMVSLQGDDASEKQELNKLERKFERTFLVDLRDVAVKIPHEVFKLRLPPFVNLEVKNQGQLIVSDRAELRPRRDQNLVLRVGISPSCFLKQEEVGVHLSLTVLQYHGLHFEWKESEVTQRSAKNIRVSRENGKTEETMLLTFPSVGTYLIRLESYLHQIEGTTRNKQFGVETKRFIKVKID